MKKILLIVLIFIAVSCSKEVKKPMTFNVENWLNARERGGYDYLVEFMNDDYLNYLYKKYNVNSQKKLISYMKNFDFKSKQALNNKEIYTKSVVCKEIQSSIPNIIIVKYRDYIIEPQKPKDVMFYEGIVVIDKNTSPTTLIKYGSSNFEEIDSIIQKKYKSDILLNEIKTYSKYQNFNIKNKADSSIKIAFDNYVESITTKDFISFKSHLLIPTSFKKSFSKETFLDLANIKSDVSHRGYYLSGIEQIHCDKFKSLYFIDFDIDLGNNIYAVGVRALVQKIGGNYFFLLYSKDTIYSLYEDIISIKEMDCIVEKMEDIGVYN